MILKNTTKDDKMSYISFPLHKCIMRASLVYSLPCWFPVLNLVVVLTGYSYHGKMWCLLLVRCYCFCFSLLSNTLVYKHTNRYTSCHIFKTKITLSPHASFPADLKHIGRKWSILSLSSNSLHNLHSFPFVKTAKNV